MKRYHDIVGDGGSGVLEQVVAQRGRIEDNLAGVGHVVAVGSGKGGVGKSTVTRHLAGALAAYGARVAVLDADLNGPSQAHLGGIEAARMMPIGPKVTLPRTRDGVAVFSMGSLIPASAPLAFESTARDASHTWRATREFTLLAEVLETVEWGALDVLLCDLPPGTERTVQYADFLGPRASLVLVTIPSDLALSVVARTVTALADSPNRMLGYVENMSGYYCRDCGTVKPMFTASASSPLRIPHLGSVPFDPALGVSHDDGMSHGSDAATPVRRAFADIAARLADDLALPMEATR